MPVIIILSGVLISVWWKNLIWILYINNISFAIFTKFKKTILVSIISGVLLTLITVNNPIIKDRMINKVYLGLD